MKIMKTIRIRKNSPVTLSQIKKLFTELRKDLREDFATKDDLKRFATKEDISDIKDELKGFATKDDLENKLSGFATKDDLEKGLARFATKSELWDLRNEMNMRFEGVATKKDMQYLLVMKDEIAGMIQKRDRDDVTNFGRQMRLQESVENHEKRITKLEKARV